jgi:hypothetical protein
LDTKTLKILSEVPIDRDPNPEVAVWHGNGKVVLTAQASSNKLVIYELVEPKSGLPVLRPSLLRIYPWGALLTATPGALGRLAETGCDAEGCHRVREDRGHL